MNKFAIIKVTDEGTKKLLEIVVPDILNINEYGDIVSREVFDNEVRKEFKSVTYSYGGVYKKEELEKVLYENKCMVISDDKDLVNSSYSNYTKSKNLIVVYSPTFNCSMTSELMQESSEVGFRDGYADLLVKHIMAPRDLFQVDANWINIAANTCKTKLESLIHKKAKLDSLLTSIEYLKLPADEKDNVLSECYIEELIDSTYSDLAILNTIGYLLNDYDDAIGIIYDDEGSMVELQ